MRKALRYIVAATVLAFWVAYVWRNWESFAALSWTLNPAYLLAAFAFYTGFYLVMGAGWALALRAMARNADFAAALRIWIVSTPARYLPGTGWHIAGRTYLGARAGMTVKDLLVSTYVEQALAVVSGLIVFVVAATFGGVVLVGTGFYLVILIPVGLTLAHPRLLQMLLNQASRALKKDSVEIKLSFSQVLALLVWFAFSHVLSGVSLFLVLASVSPTPLHMLPAVVGASALGWVVGLLSILTPGGIGVREATIVMLSSTFVAVPVMSSAAFATRFISALAEVFLVAISALVSLRRA
ncbi:MAG: flippase-like domain-containing protein [Chloroflexi bacterium]|nr:flippase-like domain-containing protein [Chloroflexota bacterium]